MCVPLFFYVYANTQIQHRKFHSIVLYKQLRNEEKSSACSSAVFRCARPAATFYISFICEANVFSELIYLNKNVDDEDDDDDDDGRAAAAAVTVIE